MLVLCHQNDGLNEYCAATWIQITRKCIAYSINESFVYENEATDTKIAYIKIDFRPHMELGVKCYRVVDGCWVEAEE